MRKGECAMWFEKQAKFKQDKAVVKLLDEKGNFRKSVIVPTVYYPLNGEYKVFHYKNTRRLIDEKAIEIFDGVPYEVGRCYSNTKRLVAALRSGGYNAKSFAGWLFTSDSQFPVHHNWCVLDNDIVLDLADDYTVMLSGENGEQFKDKSIEEVRELIIDFYKAARLQPNHVRCSPVGTPTDFFLYIGCECEPEDGKTIYNNLIREYPDHECQRNCDDSGMNTLQRKMKQEGLMEWIK